MQQLFQKFDRIRGLQLFQLLRFSGVFITGLLLSKGPLDLDTIGAYESILFLSAAASFFWVSGLLNGMLATYPEQTREQKGIHLFNIALMIFAAGLALAIILQFFQSATSVVLKSDSVTLYPQILLYIIINTPTFINEYILLLEDRSKSIASYGILLFIGNIIAVAGPAFLGMGLEGMLHGLLLFSFLKFIITLILIRKFGVFVFDTAIIKKHLYFSLPLILSLLISGSADYIDGFLVSTHFGSSAFALFRYGARELPISLILANALSSAMVPVITEKEKTEEGIRQLKNESKKLMHFLFPISVLLLIGSRWFYPLIFREEFAESSAYFNVYLLLLISRMVFPQTIVMAFRDTKAVFRIAIAEIVVNVVCSYILMLYFGIMGIAIGTLIAFGTEKLLLSLYLSKKYGVRFTTYTPVKQWIAYSIILTATYIFVHNFT